MNALLLYTTGLVHLILGYLIYKHLKFLKHKRQISQVHASARTSLKTEHRKKVVQSFKSPE